MVEKKAGLRQMMNMSGLTSIEYFTGLMLGDLTIYSIPCTILSILIYFLPQIMDASFIAEFWICYMLYGAAIINIVYIFTHWYTEPDQIYRSISLLFTLGLTILPISLSIWGAW